MSLSQKIYTGPLRRWARELGLIRLVGAPTRLREQARLRRYAREKPTVTVVDVGPGLAVKGHTDSLAEYRRTMSLLDDRHLVRALRRVCRAGDVAWDVGANIGLYSAALSRVVGEGTVVAFEPEPRAREQMERNLRLNDARNVVVVPVALGRREGQASLFHADEGVDGTHSLVAEGGRAAITIDVARGDELRRRDDLAVPNVIKVDVEGAEEDVLVGLEETLADPACRAVLCEIHFAVLAAAGREDAPEWICARLRDAGLTRQKWLDASHLLATR